MRIKMDITEKYYRGYVTIDLDAIYNNIEKLKNNLKIGTKVAAVIKTDGYGHGAVPIAFTIEDLVDAYAVATIDEAINLREHGVTKPIYVIGYTHEGQMERFVEYDVRPTIFTMQSALVASNAAVNMEKNIKIHIKIDTGMGRIGFRDDDESIEIIKQINKLSNVEIEGIFTHFATADEKDKKRAKKQYDRFKNFTDKLEEQGVHIPIKHCSNSAAMMEMNYANMDCVRAGIAMYGLYPSEEVDKENIILTPALSFKSHIIFVKEIEKGTEISYGGTFVADKKMKVATIPVGYGDGYRRSLSNKGYVLIRGKKAPIIGRVCMDQFMVDVTEIKDVENGDLVTLIGKDGKEDISAEKLAELAGETFNYEIVCDLGKRIPRIYYRNGKIICTKDYFADKYVFNTIS
jgi:alanine racemase